MNRHQRRLTKKHSDSGRDEPPSQLTALITQAAQYQSAGQFQKAEEVYKQIIALKPDYAEAYNNLGSMLLNQGKTERAVAPLLHALGINPSIAEVHNNLGNALRCSGKLDSAVAHYRQAIALKPHFVEAYNNLGIILTDQDNLKEASELFAKALTVNPDYIEAHYNRSILRKFRMGDAELTAMQTIATRADRLTDTQKMYLYFALGKALDDAGDYPQAFENLQKANALKRQSIQYDEAARRTEFKQIADTFTPELMQRLGGVGNPSHIPIFVLGMPRSGSTLIAQILASHPQIQAAGELEHMHVLANSIATPARQPVPYPVYIPGMNADILRELGAGYLKKLPAFVNGKTRIIDKAPINFRYVGLIKLLFPNAKIIHTMRSPEDTCFSCFSKLFSISHGYNYSYDLAELGRYYRYYTQLMEHWRHVLPAGGMLDVSYEALVDDLETHARRLINYCGLPWNDDCLNFHKTKRIVSTLSKVQVRQPLFRTSLEKWRRYEAYLGPLLAELLA